MFLDFYCPNCIHSLIFVLFVAVVRRITGGSLPNEVHHHESALLYWLSHVCAALKRRIDNEIEHGASDEHVIIVLMLFYVKQKKKQHFPAIFGVESLLGSRGKEEAGGLPAAIAKNTKILLPKIAG